MEVKKGMEKKYKKYLKLNTSWKREIWASDVLFGKKKVATEEWMGLSYNLAVVAATEAVGAALTAGKTPKEAEEWLNCFGLSIAQAGFASQHVSEFHPRGEEYRKYWNSKFGVMEEGTAFPACMEIKPKKGGFTMNIKKQHDDKIKELIKRLQEKG